MLKFKCRNFLIFLFLIILVQAKVHAFQIKDNQTVDANKTWTIKFTDDVSIDEITKSGIIVTNSKGSPANVIISKGNDSKSIFVKAPQEGYTPGESYTLTVNTKAHSNKGKNLKQIRSIHFNVKSTDNDNFDMTKIEANSIKLYYDDDDIKADIRFSRGIENANADDFTIAGVKPSSVAVFGSKVTLTFKDGKLDDSGSIVTYENGKNNSKPNKTDVIKASGVNAQLKIVDNPTTCDETGTPIASSLSLEQSKVYYYQLGPKTTSDYWSATTDGKVYITFDTPIDANGGIRSDDFIFACGGTNINADSILILGKTVVFKFDNNQYKNYFTNGKQIDIRAKDTALVRGERDRDNKYSSYKPSNDDLRNRTISITE